MPELKYFIDNKESGFFILVITIDITISCTATAVTLEDQILRG